MQIPQISSQHEQPVFMEFVMTTITLKWKEERRRKKERDGEGEGVVVLASLHLY